MTTTATRRVGATLALLLPLTGGVLLTTAPAAGAAVTSPGNGTVYTAHASVQVRADYGRSTSENTLSLTSPGGPAVVVASAPGNLSGGTLSYAFDTGCWTAGCSGRKPAPNGTWTVTQSGGSSGSSTFVTRIPPAVPTSVTATALNPREARVTWRVGDEPDLVGYAVLEGGGVVKELPRSACDAGTCSTVVSYATEGTGEHAYTVRAARAVAPGSSATVESAPSSAATVRLESPPPPAAEPAPSQGTATGGSTGGTAGGSTGGSSTSPSTGSGGSTGEAGAPTGPSGGSSARPDAGGGSAPAGATPGSAPGSTAPIGTGTTSAQGSADAQAVAQRKAFALTFSAFGPKLGIPKLPPLPQGQAPEVAPEIADGDYDATLPGFGEDRVVRERVEVARGSSGLASSAVGTAFDRDRLLTSTAGALVLLLAGAHLRRWLGATARDAQL